MGVQLRFHTQRLLWTIHTLPFNISPWQVNIKVEYQIIHESIKWTKIRVLCLLHANSFFIKTKQNEAKPEKQTCSFKYKFMQYNQLNSPALFQIGRKKRDILWRLKVPSYGNTFSLASPEIHQEAISYSRY